MIGVYGFGLAAARLDDEAPHPVGLHDEIARGRHGQERKSRPLPERPVHSAQYLKRVVGAHMAHRAADELYVVAAGLVFDRVDLGPDAVHSAGSAE